MNEEEIRTLARRRADFTTLDVDAEVERLNRGRQTPGSGTV